MILNDKQILRLCQDNKLLDPYVDHSVKTKLICPKEIHCESQVEYEKIISYGLSSMGYDLRAADEWQVFSNIVRWGEQPEYVFTSNGVGKRDIHKLSHINGEGLIDPKSLNPNLLYEQSGRGYCLIPPNTVALTRSLEYIRMPDDVLGVCLGKSTYARCGLIVNITPAEPGWHGHLTIEISNTTPYPVKVYGNEGICQMLFFKGERPAVTYSDRGGKYNGQTGITGAIV